MLGVIGLGVIGVFVVNDVFDLDMDVIGFDLFIFVNIVWNLFCNV